MQRQLAARLMSMAPLTDLGHEGHALRWEPEWAAHFFPEPMGTVDGIDAYVPIDVDALLFEPRRMAQLFLAGKRGHCKQGGTRRGTSARTAMSAGSSPGLVSRTSRTAKRKKREGHHGGASSSCHRLHPRTGAVQSRTAKLQRGVKLSGEVEVSGDVKLSGEEGQGRPEGSAKVRESTGDDTSDSWKAWVWKREARWVLIPPPLCNSTIPPSSPPSPPLSLPSPLLPLLLLCAILLSLSSSPPSPACPASPPPPSPP